MITVAITARNEANSIADCLCSLQKAVQLAEQKLDMKLQLVVILNDCTDDTEAIVLQQYPGIEIIHTSGGIVEAQRAVAHRQPFVIFSDADLLYEPETIYLLVQTMLSKPELQVAYPQKRPLPPLKRTLVSAMLYSYNLNNGFQVHRPYFDGKCFAIRNWSVPAQQEVQARASQLTNDPFLDYKTGMRVDDIYLSRFILSSHGSSAICEVPGALIHFRPPATLSGMYQTSKRMTVEFERMDNLFPELAHRHVVRKRDEPAWRGATRQQRGLHRLFLICLQGCNLRLSAERWISRIRGVSPDHWPAIPETKQSPIDKGSTKQHTNSNADHSA